MKNSLVFISKIITIFLALSAIILAVAVFRYEIEEFFELVADKVRRLCSKCRLVTNEEYADFADV